MKLLAFSDIHSPKYLPKLKHVLEKHRRTITSADLVLIAGDLTKKGSIQGLAELIKTLQEYLDSKPIIACPGNEDFEQVVNKIKREKQILLLDDEEVKINIGKREVKIYGTRGVLDEPTLWQKKNIKNIYEIYESRLRKLRELLKAWSCSSERLCIVLSHYSITYSTLEGEDKRIWRQLGTCKLDLYLGKPLLIIHGHAHNSTQRAVRIGDTLILNVSFPKVEGVFLVEVELPNNFKVTLLRLDGSTELKPHPVRVIESRQQESPKTQRETILDFLG